MFILVEQKLLEYNLSQLTDEEIQVILEEISEDKELLNEFLGALAKLGGRFASALGNKLQGGAGKLNAYAQRKSNEKDFKSARTDRVNKIRSHAQALRSKDPYAHYKTFLPMAKSKNTLARVSSKLSDDPIAAAKAKKAKHMAIRQKHGLKTFLECILRQAGITLNEGSMGEKRLRRKEKPLYKKQMDNLNSPSTKIAVKYIKNFDVLWNKRNYKFDSGKKRHEKNNPSQPVHKDVIARMKKWPELYKP